MQFREIIGADLTANIGRSGFRAGLAAFIFHPGFSTIFLHRLAMEAKERGFRRFANLIWCWNVRRSGCHLHLDSIIGAGLYLPHPISIVIGSGSRIGSLVTIYQGVTIGKDAREAVYPSIGKGVILYPNCIIVGGITVGDNAVVGAGSIVRNDVPSNATVVGSPARIIRKNA